MRRTIGIVLAVIGVLAFIGSYAWNSHAVPRLVKFPTDVDSTPVYAGKTTIYLNQKTYAPLATPIVANLQVTRHVEAIADQSTSNRVVLSEKIKLTAQGLFTGNLDSQYVMNRKTIRNVDSPNAWAFAPTNHVDRSPAYRLAFPFDTQPKDYLIYNNNINATYTATPAGEGEVEGMKVLKFNAVLSKPAPVTPAYLAAINKITPLPASLTLTQLKPILLSAGVDVDKLTAALLPHLTKPDLTTLVALQQQKVKLLYLYGFTGSDSIEPSTGSIVDLHDDETVYATPDPTVLPKLSAILAKYKTVPAAVQAVTALGKLAANPIKVFENNFQQTPASIADIASTVKDKKDQKHLAESTIPNALRYGGIALFVVGLLLAIIPKRRKPNTADFSGPITIATDPDLFVGPGQSTGGGPSDPPVP